MPSQSKNNFNGIAPVYDLLSTLIFGNTLLKAQKAFLHLIPENATILFIGGGTGKILPDILKRKPQAIWYVEKSEKMLQQARKRISNLSMLPIHWIEGDENHPVVKENQFDVVLTFFLFDLFDKPTLHTLIQRLYASLKSNGLWMVADFAPQNKTWIARTLMKSMYTFFRIVSQVQASQLESYIDILESLSLHPVHSKLFYARMIQSIVYRKTI
ncbi:class I SAM-dependent methyltransferase [Xanthocytophaga agilis]|uniref:Methyltransferase domain-containing protein n=1 Tax=Xanthocytophaga agilis TaxID=3048010 RepID=A0AAE3R913_9BACT|nr:methyltransferase domain-containing protein [Xanthocytophaga agilis]MDJ1503695.1 methyltransferase domain-containing protein [Xanthocytophaga agilis]